MFSKGDTIGAYELIRKLGGGAFGEVWLGRHRELGLDRAIKIPTDPDYVKQLRQEGKIQAQVRHPNIVETVDLNTMHDPPYFVMEYVAGQDLRKRLKADGRLPVAEALDILRQILDALICAHSQGVLHRDLKPENILLAPDGRVKVTDFGLGKIQADLAQSLLLSGSMMSSQGVSVSGTFQYMSPEQQSGREPDPRDDVYSVGIIGCELLTGRRPSGAGIARAMVRCRIDRAVGDLFEKASDEPEYRYESASQMRAAIASLLHDMPVGQGDGSRADGSPPGSRDRPARLRSGQWNGPSEPRDRGAPGDEAITPAPTPPALEGHDASVGIALPSIRKVVLAVLAAAAVMALGTSLLREVGYSIGMVIILFSLVIAALIFGRTFRFFRRADLLLMGILYTAAIGIPWLVLMFLSRRLFGYGLLFGVIPAIGLSFIMSRRLHGSVLSHAIVQIPLWLGMWAARAVFERNAFWSWDRHLGIHYSLAEDVVLGLIVGLAFATVEAVVIYLVAREGTAHADGSDPISRSARKWPVVYVGVLCIIISPVLVWPFVRFFHDFNMPTVLLLLPTTGLVVGGGRLLRRPCCFAWLQMYAFSFLSCCGFMYVVHVYGHLGVLWSRAYGRSIPPLMFWPVLLLPALVPVLRRMKAAT